MIDKEAELKHIFNLLQKNQIPYMVLRGFDEIPQDVTYSNDLDLLCKQKDQKQIFSIFKQLGYKFYEDSVLHHTYLYAALPHQHFRDKKKDIHIDIVYNLSYRSPNKGEWVSIHEDLQHNIWKNKQSVESFWSYQPSHHDELLHLLCHSIFDKQEFRRKYILRIDELLPLTVQKRLLQDLELVFFKYSVSLLEQIKNRQYESIISNYLSFKEY